MANYGRRVHAVNRISVFKVEFGATGAGFGAGLGYLVVQNPVCGPHRGPPRDTRGTPVRAVAPLA